MCIRDRLEDYIKGKERERGYLHVMTPCIGTVNLYKTSGHWDHYRENMFPAMENVSYTHLMLRSTWLSAAKLMT